MENTRKISGFEALRGVAVVMVMTSHVPLFISLPTALHEVLAVPLLGISVDLFFVISGFVTAQSFARDCDAVAFIQRRMIRLFPLLLLTVAAVALCSLLVGTAHWREWALGVAFLGNVSKVMGNTAQASVLSPLWSVATEMQFYLCVPLLMLLPTGVKHVAIVAVLIIGCFWVRSWGSTAWYWRPEAFLLGHLVFCERERIIHHFSKGVSPLALCLPFLALAIVGRLFQDSAAGVYIVLVALVAATIVALALQASAAPTFEWLGRRSYALYLSHLPLLYLFGGIAPWPIAIAASGISIVLLSHVLTVGFDEPLRRQIYLRGWSV